MFGSTAEVYAELNVLLGKIFLSVRDILFLSAFAPTSHAKCITFAKLTHKGQPQHREFHALLFSNSVWVLKRPTLNL